MGQPSTRGPFRRRLLALVLGVPALAAVAWFVVAAASATHAAFSGCWLSCGGDPAPAWGVLWAIALAAVLGTPIGLALRHARVRSRIAWAAAAIVVLAAVVAWVLFSLDPDTADFFVS